MNFIQEETYYAQQENPAVYGNPKPRRNILPWLILIILVILVIAGFLFRDRLFYSQGISGAGDGQSANKPSVYSAVSLTNGQVYFGKLKGAGDEFMTLTDVFYLQQSQSPQQASQSGQAAAGQPQLSLVKLGSELHGPTDQMTINSQQVLFYEELKADSKIVQAIEEYKKNQAASPRAISPQSGK